MFAHISKSCERYSKSLAWNAISYAQSIIPFEQHIKSCPQNMFAEMIIMNVLKVPP